MVQALCDFSFVDGAPRRGDCDQLSSHAPPYRRIRASTRLRPLGGCCHSPLTGEEALDLAASRSGSRSGSDGRGFTDVSHAVVSEPPRTSFST